MLREMFVSMREEVTGDCRQMNDEEFKNLYVIKVTKLMKMRRARRVRDMGELSIDGIIMLQTDLK